MTHKEFRSRRNKLGFTQELMAKKLGVSIRAIKYYESGQRPISKTLEILFNYIESENT